MAIFKKSYNVVFDKFLCISSLSGAQSIVLVSRSSNRQKGFVNIYWKSVLEIAFWSKIADIIFYKLNLYNYIFHYKTISFCFELFFLHVGVLGHLKTIPTIGNWSPVCV
jgi:hypothetical protein